MIPLRDVIPSRTTPFVTIGLVAATSIVFLFEWLSPSDALSHALTRWAVVPAHLWTPALVTALVLHAGVFTLVANMVCLWIFGGTVEDRFGHTRFLLFYLGSGVLAGLAHKALAPTSLTPVVGAAGPVAAVMGAYLVLFPRSRVQLLVWLLVFIDIVEIPAVVLFGCWLLVQIFDGTWTLAGATDVTGLDLTVLTGALGAGLAAGRLLARRERAGIEWWG